MIAVLYHAGCVDGFTAAWVASLKLGRGPHVEYVPVRYGDELPNVAVVAADTVMILDFAVRRVVLEQLVHPADVRERQVIMLDHHRTALEEWGVPHQPVKAGGGRMTVIIDEAKCGASLTWAHLFPGQAMPRLLQYVEDHDLWRHVLADSREISAWISSWPFSFETWAGMARQLDSSSDRDVGRAVDDGRAILRAMRREVEAACRQARMEEWAIPARGPISGIEHVMVAVVNSAHYPSEIAERLNQTTPRAEFAAVYHDRADAVRQWHLRSRPGGFDVSHAAKARGGGGHPYAAGFEERR